MLQEGNTCIVAGQAGSVSAFSKTKPSPPTPLSVGEGLGKEIDHSGQAKALFVTQGIDRIQQSCFPRRIEAEEDAYGDGEAEGKKYGERRDDRRPFCNAGDDTGTYNADQDACHAAKQTEHKRFYEKLGEDVP